MKVYFIQRLLWSLLTLLGITLLTFFVSRLVPGGPVDAWRGDIERGSVALSPDQIQQLEELLGLDQSLWSQYWTWLRRFAVLDFGTSMTHSSLLVKERVWHALRISFPMQLCSILLIYIIGVPVGVISAVRYRSFWERLVSISLFSMYVVPSFVMASLLLYTFCAGQPFYWFPMIGLHSFGWQSMSTWHQFTDLLWHLVLPVLCLTYGGLAVISRMTRAGMLEVLQQDYIRTARAKGLTESRVILRHALRNGILPVVTLLGTLLPYLFGGSIIIESVFSVPGMGTLIYEAITERDYPTVMAVTVLVGVATLFGYFVSDLLLAWLNPRIRWR